MAVSAPSAASLLADFVAAALAAHLRHDDRAYDTLLAQLSASVKANDSAAVSRWLAAIAGCSSTIASAGPASFRGLLSLLLDHVALPSLGADSLPTYCSFLVDFATAAHTQQGAAEAALRKLVDALHFAAEPEQRASNDRSDEASTAAGAAHSDAQQVHVAAHAALKRLVRLLPSSLSLLWSLLVDCFPHSRQSTASWLAYVANLLLLAEYCPTLRERVLTAITERLTQLDVEITAAQQQQQQQQSEEPQPAMADRADGLVTLLDRQLLDGEDARRLDALLCLLMRYLSSLQQQQRQSAVGLTDGSAVGAPSSGGGSALSDDVFFSLLRVFSASILPTHRVQLVPFVLLYVCSLSHTYAESFLRWLLERAFDESVQPAVRVACVSYVQSFVARASFLRHVSVALTFRHMLEWTTQLSDYTELQWRQHFTPQTADAAVPAVGPLDAPQFSVFYSCFQCVLYMFVYRGRQFEAEMDAQTDRDDDEDEEEEQPDEEDDERENLHMPRSEASSAWLLDSSSWQTPDKRAAGLASSSPASSRFPTSRARPRYSGSLTRSRLRVLVSAMVLSPLQPLRYCLPAVVQQFSRLARDMDIVDLRPVLRSIRRSAASPRSASSASSLTAAAAAGEPSSQRRSAASAAHLSHSSLNNGSGLLGYTAASQLIFDSEASTASSQLMQAYFPFDPYLMSQSARLIAPLYTFAPPAAASKNEHGSPPSHIAGKRKSQAAAAPSAAQRWSGGSGEQQSEERGGESAESDGTEHERSNRRKRADDRRPNREWGVEEAAAARTAAATPQRSRPTSALKQQQSTVRQYGRLDEEDDEEESERAEEKETEEEEEAALLSYSPGFGPSLSVPAAAAAAAAAVSPRSIAEPGSDSPLVHLSPPVASPTARRPSSSSVLFLSPLPPSALRRSAGGQGANSASLLSRDRHTDLMRTPAIPVLRSTPAG